MAPKVTLPKDEPFRLLVIKPSSLGDVVHSLPFLNAVNGSYPKAQIQWVIARGLYGLLEGHPMVERLWIIDKDNWKRPSRAFGTAGELFTLWRGLRMEGFDIAVDLQGLLRSGLMTMATKAPMRIGFKEAREGSGLFYTHEVEGGREAHAVDRYLKAAAYLGCDISDIRFPLRVSETSPIQGRYAVLVPGARWKTKRWPAKRFGELASMLPVKSVIVGGALDTGIASAVVEHSKGKAVSMVGHTSLRELAGVMKGAEFVVSNDSGPMHIAAALGVPVFAIFGPTSPVRTGPYGKGHVIIKTTQPCAPCFKRNCEEKKCMADISVEQVFEAIASAMTLDNRMKRVRDPGLDNWLSTQYN